MLITPSLLHVKTGPARNRQEPAVLGRGKTIYSGFVMDGLAAGDVLSRLDVTVLDRGPEMIEWACIRLDHGAMALRGEWSDVLDALRFADQDRSMASGGQRVAPLISEGLRATLIRAIAAGDIATAEAELVRFQAVMELQPDDYCAAHLVAEAQIDLGLAKRALASDGQLSNGLWTESARHFEEAERLLDMFDPIEELSPLLAATRYRLVRGIEDGASLCRDWFEDWCDLDPEDANAHAAHAQMMLPGWFGSLAIFEREAKRAAAMTAPMTGSAAYAIFHMTARSELGVLMASVDLPLFLRGMLDFQSATGCQHRANVAASTLSALARDYEAEGSMALYQLTKVRAALSDILWNRLYEVHLDRWEGGADGLAYALAQVFGPALQRGARITRKGEGLATRIPRRA
jgi:hypothetical protein